MRTTQLQRVDLNLLVTLAVLLEERHVSRAADSFRVAGTGYASSVLGPVLFRRMFQQAPGTSLHFGTWHDAIWTDVEHGVVDLAFTGYPPTGSLRSERLFEERFACLMSADHPLAEQESLNLKEFLDAAHVKVTVLQGEQSAVDKRLTELGN